MKKAIIHLEVESCIDDCVYAFTDEASEEAEVSWRCGQLGCIIGKATSPHPIVAPHNKCPFLVKG